jgi:hypothetical protein
MFMLKKKRLKKLARAHTILSIGLFGVYFVLATTYSPEFLFSDIQNKFSVLADNTIMVTAKVLAPPVKPIVSAVGACDMGVFKISLSWPSDENSVSFDISRNGDVLITGLSLPQYTDSNTTTNNAYTYVVTAYGPMGPGFAASDPITINSPNICGSTSAPPTISLTPINPDDGYYMIFNNTRPRFSGTTNLPNALINLEIYSTQIISGQTLANVNGYWSWDPPLNIPNGPHILYATATDPLNSSQVAYGELPFKINFTFTDNSDSKDSADSDKKNKKKMLSPSITSVPISSIANEKPSSNIPLTYSLSFQQDSIQQGKTLEPIVFIEEIDPKYVNRSAELIYSIYNTKNNLVFSEKDSIVLTDKKNIGKNISLPNYLKDGKYILKTDLIFDSFIIEQEKSFQITPDLFLNFGGGAFITYPDFLSTMGTVSMISLLLLLIWLFLFYREYWLYLHAARHITEKTLEKLGMISIKKGRGVSK